MDRIIRINPLIEALRSASERVNKVFVQEEKGHARIGEVIREAKARHVPVVFVPVRRLDQIAPGHQGVMAEVSPKGYASLEEILARSAKPFVVITHTNAPAPSLMVILKLNPDPRIFSPKSPYVRICSTAFFRRRTARGYSART